MLQARLRDLSDNADKNPDVDMALVVDPRLNDQDGAGDTLSDLYYKHDIRDSLLTLVCVYLAIVALSLACALCHALPNCDEAATCSDAQVRRSWTAPCR